MKKILILLLAVGLAWSYAIFLMPDTWEPQDVLMFGFSDGTRYSIDGVDVGAGTYACVSDVRPGRRRLMIHDSHIAGGSFTQPIYVNDTTVSQWRLSKLHFEPSSLAELSNCSDPEQVREQTTSQVMFEETEAPRDLILQSR